LEGAFHRWWVDEMKRQGKKVDPSASHLFSITYGKKHPSTRNADFIENEGVSPVVQYGVNVAQVESYKVPLVMWELSAPVGICSWEGATGERLCSSGWAPLRKARPDDIRRGILMGLQPSETYLGIESSSLTYYLQARWYLENITSWADEDFINKVARGNEVNAARLPVYTPSNRPVLTNPAGYTNGVKTGSGTLHFACTYQDADNDPPAQAEVWVDRNSDGRFDPTPSRSERIQMVGNSIGYKNGVTYIANNITVSSTGKVNYVFRFADKHWYPPVKGGLVPGRALGISYDHWTVNVTATSSKNRVWEPANPQSIPKLPSPVSTRDLNSLIQSVPNLRLYTYNGNPADTDNISSGSLFLVYSDRSEFLQKIIVLK
jgi:hypothetical protein